MATHSLSKSKVHLGTVHDSSGTRRQLEIIFFRHFSHMMFIPMNTKYQSLIEPRRFNHFSDESDQPPPLPVKKKHSKFFISYFIAPTLIVASDSGKKEKLN